MITDTDLDQLIFRSNPVRSFREINGSGDAAQIEFICSRPYNGADVLERTFALHDAVHLEFQDRVAVLKLDDGGPNVLTRAVIHAFLEAIDLCEMATDIDVLAIIGRESFFSAGLDRNLFIKPKEVVAETLDALAELLIRLYGSSLRIVTACTGHAIAAGALLMLTADVCIGTRGSFKIGMNEAAIGLKLPAWANYFARHRLPESYVQEAIMTGQLYTPSQAIAAGFIDLIVETDIDKAMLREARSLGTLNIAENYETTLSSREECLNQLRAMTAK